MPEKLPHVEEILHSGALAYGKWGRAFERALQNYLHCVQEPIVVNSFTAAIQVMLSTLGINNGDEIIASPQSCLASTMPLLAFGVKVVWADIDPKRGTLCPLSVERKISSKTKAIFHSHHCGYPGYVDEINEIARRRRVWVLDDCIEALGARYKGKLLGALDADATLFSFQTVRLPNTIDGGAIVFKRMEHTKKALIVRDLGVDRTTFRDSLGEINPDSDVSYPGYGVTMNEVSSYIGCQQMNDIEGLLMQQNQNAKAWKNTLSSKYLDIQLIENEDIVPNYWVLGVIAKDKVTTLERFRKLGYACSSVHLPNTFYSAFGYQGHLPGVLEFYRHFIALPCGWWYKKQIDE